MIQTGFAQTDTKCEIIDLLTQHRQIFIHPRKWCCTTAKHGIPCNRGVVYTENSPIQENRSNVNSVAIITNDDIDGCIKLFCETTMKVNKIDNNILLLRAKCG